MLLVENDSLLRSCLIDVLSEAGLSIEVAFTAAEALALADSLQAPAVLVTDLQLDTGMDGLGLAALARRRWPGIRTILMSGDHEVANRICGPIDKFVPKPFGEFDLLQAIRD